MFEQTVQAYKPKGFDYHVVAGLMPEYMFNDHAHWKPWGALKADKKMKWPLFVRPDSGLKSFSGDVFKSASEVPAAPDELVAYGPVQPIEAEYRFYVVNSKIITQSKYLPEESADVPEDVVTCAKSLVQILYNRGYRHLDYTLDVVVSGGLVYLLETNCLFTSGLYKCDKEKLENAINSDMALPRTDGRG